MRTRWEHKQVTPAEETAIHPSTSRPPGGNAQTMYMTPPSLFPAGPIACLSHQTLSDSQQLEGAKEGQDSLKTLRVSY